MIKTVMIEGREYVPATYAGKHFGYTKDYLLLLIKNGKIDGQKVSNKWYVHLPTAEVFFALAKKDQEVRRKKLSPDRKRELKEHTKIDTRAGKHTALLQTLVMLVLGLSVGATSFVGTTVPVASSVASEYNFLEHIAVALYRTINPEYTGERASDALRLDGVNHVAQVGGTTPTSSVIVAPAHAFSEERISAVRESFSDEVHIVQDPEHPDTGIVTPVFKNTDDESYRFLMVPVRTVQNE